MAITQSQKHVLAFFLQGGASVALFRWLEFRLFVAQKPLKLAGADSTSLPVVQYLERWQAQAPLVLPARWFLWLLTVIVALVGFGAMAGVLTLNGVHAVNIWLPLALFAFLPLLMTLSSAYVSLLSPHKQQLTGHPWLTFLVTKLNLSPYLSFKNLLLPWLFWQTQVLALVFIGAALFSFFVLATFQDYHFGWSSTLIADNKVMVQAMAVVSWPWHWWVAAPSVELIEQSRMVAQGAFSTELTHQRWWPTLVMAILFYGVAPRLLLAAWLRHRFLQQLKKSITNHADVEQFVVAQQHQVSQSPLTSTLDYQPPGTLLIDANRVDLITWQQVSISMPTIKNLGTDDWLADDAWLASEQSQRSKPVCLLVDPLQTPTGELADCMAGLSRKNTSVTLVLWGSTADENRLQTQLKSWQFFAQRHQLSLKQGVQP